MVWVQRFGHLYMSDNNKHHSTHKLVCWQVTRHCNRKCSFCISYSSPSIKHPERDIEKSLEKLYHLGVRKLSYSGGEPILYPKFDEMICKANSFGFKQILTSNGDYKSFFNNDRVSFFEYIKISFYGDQIVHDSIMGKGHFNGILETIKTIKNNGGKVGVNYVVSENTQACLDNFLKTISLYEIDNVLIMTLMSNGRGTLKYFSSTSKISLQLIKDTCRKYKFFFTGGIKIHDYREREFYMVVNENEQVTIPISRKLKPHVVGSIYDEYGSLPNGQVLKMDDVFETVWQKRLSTNSIIPIN